MKVLVSIILSIIMTLAVAEPATPTDMYVSEPFVSVSIEFDTPLDMIKVGDPITLRCIAIGIRRPYDIQWQYSEDAEEWFDLPCNEEVYEFILTPINANLFYRVCIYQRDEQPKEEMFTWQDALTAAQGNSLINARWNNIMRTYITTVEHPRRVSADSGNS